MTDIPVGGSYDFVNVTLGTYTSAGFTIENLGTGDLYLTGSPEVQISGPNAGDFIVTGGPFSRIPASGSGMLFMRFTPSGLGLRTATVSIPNNDSDENPYTFTVNGWGIITQGDYYVDINNGTNDINHGTSGGVGAWKTLHYAIAQINGGDPGTYILHVASGTYNQANGEGPTNIIITRSNLIITGEGSPKPVIQGGSTWIIGFEISGIITNVTIENLDIQGFWGNAIIIEGNNSRIENCFIHNNITGIFISGAAINPTISQNEISDNCDGIDSQSSNALIERNRVHDNTGCGTGIRLLGGTIRNNLIYGNSPEAIYANGETIYIYHNTIDGEGINGDTGIYFAQGGVASPEIKYNIITGFDVGIQVDSGTVTVDYNDLCNPDPLNPDPDFPCGPPSRNYAGVAVAGPNDISQDPRYKDPGIGDFSLQSDSPCINAIPLGSGDPVTEDYNANQRPIGTGFDMGAYEACAYILKTFGSEWPLTWIQLPFTGGTTGVNVTASSSNCSWTATSSDPSWLTIEAPSSGIGDGSFFFSVAAAGPGPLMTGTITLDGSGFTVYRGQIVIAQLAGDPAGGYVTPPYQFLGYNETATFTVTVNPSYYIVSVSEGSLIGSTWTIPSVTDTPHYVTITFSACTYDLSITSEHFLVGGGTGGVAVTAGSGCAWTAVSNNPSWISVTSPLGGIGTGSGTVSYSVAANSGPPRSGTMTIAGQYFTVNQRGITGITLNSAPNPSTYGESVTFTAFTTVSVPTPTATVDFFDGGTSYLGFGGLSGVPLSASISTSALTAGTHSITAVYSGDSNYFDPSTSSPLSQVVNQANTTTAITGHTPDPSSVGQSVNVSYSVTSSGGTPTGNVTVTVSGGSESCTDTVAAGGCSITLTSLGLRTLTATYGGDSNFNGSTSAGVPHTVVAPEINLKQGGTSILVGGSYDFGSVVLGANTSVTFTIENLGTADLNLTGLPKVEISGVNAADFVVTS